MKENKTGYIYLIHYESKLAHSQHYLGWTTNLGKRIELHNDGKATVPMTRAFAEAGIAISGVSWCEGDRNGERKLKKWNKSRQLCSFCKNEVGIIPNQITYVESEKMRQVANLPRKEKKRSQAIFKK
jgi:predicted GIY-YIG superfamily endonuclease